MIAIGIGCRRGTPAALIESLIRQALAQTAITVGTGRPSATCDTTHRALFTVEDKAGEPGLIEAARNLNLPLTFLPRDALRAQPARTRSPRAEALFGIPAVAEPAALAGAGPNATLILPRIAAHGVTCAIARQGATDTIAATE